MALFVNRATILGVCGKDAEIRTTTNGTKVANFTVATTSKWKAKDGTPREETTWHQVTAWGTLAGLVEQVVFKGTKVYVDGPIAVEQFDARDGTRRTKTFIRADQVVSLGTGKDRVASGGQGIVRAPPAQKPAEGSIPFDGVWVEPDMPF